MAIRLTKLKLITDEIKLFRTKLRLYQNIYFSTIINENLKETNTTNNLKDNVEKTPLSGPHLRDFFPKENLKIDESSNDSPPYLNKTSYGSQRNVYFEVYGCQMNVNDTEIVWSILKDHDFQKTNEITNADIILIVTCSIREGAESKIWKRLDYLKSLNKKRSQHLGPLKIGILGCMAERLKHQLLENDKSVDLVAGPDSYRDLPRLLALTNNNHKSVNVLLSLDETYADIVPVRLNENSVTAFVSIMRGCDNMCTYCIVPFTRGRERSRPLSSILKEIEHLSNKGVKEVTLLGQNVNSYRDLSENKDGNPTVLAPGFKTVYKPKLGGLRFADLLAKVAEIDPEMRIRFTSPHPKDFPNEVLEIIKSKPNICNNLHIPAQSGNSNVLERMRRGYTRESYLELIDNVRFHLPNVGLSSDFICGFCGETEEEFQDTISLIETVKYNNAYLFPYSMREKTTAHRRFTDDVSPEIKKERMERMVKAYRQNVLNINRAQIGKIQLILIEGNSKRSKQQLAGRNEQNIKVIIPKGSLTQRNGENYKQIEAGDYVVVQIYDATSQILKGIPLYHTKLVDFCLGNYTFAQDSFSFHSFL